MFDLGWSEILVIAIVALVVVGPKDLPNLLRMIGRFVRQARGVARNFQGAMDQMLRESELADLKREFNANLNDEDYVAPRIQPPVTPAAPQPAAAPPAAALPTAGPADDIEATPAEALPIGPSASQPDEPAPPKTDA